MYQDNFKKNSSENQVNQSYVVTSSGALQYSNTNGNTSYANNNDESFSEMKDQKLKLQKMQQLYNQTGALVESLSQGSKEGYNIHNSDYGDDLVNMPQSNYSQTMQSNQLMQNMMMSGSYPTINNNDQILQNMNFDENLQQRQSNVSYYYPVRGIDNLASATNGTTVMQSKPTGNTVQSFQDPLLDEYLMNEKRAAEMTRDIDFKNAMKIQTSQLNKLLSSQKTNSGKNLSSTQHQTADRIRVHSGSHQKMIQTQKNTTGKSNDSRNSNKFKSPSFVNASKFELSSHKLLKVNEVQKQKIETPQQYKYAQQAKRANKQLVDQQRRAAEREAKRISKTRFASASFSKSQSNRRKQRSHSLYGSVGEKRNSMVPVRGKNLQSDQKQHVSLRRRNTSHKGSSLTSHDNKRSFKQSSKGAKSNTNQMYTSYQDSMGQPFIHQSNYTYNDQLPQMSLNHYQVMQGSMQPHHSQTYDQLEVNLKNNNPNYYTTADRSRNEFKMVPQQILDPSLGQQVQEQNTYVIPNLMSAEFAAQLDESGHHQTTHDISNGDYQNTTAKNISGYVNTTHNESSIVDQQNNSLIQAYSQLQQQFNEQHDDYIPKAYQVQNNTFGQDDVQCLADAYNFELQSSGNQQNIFDHKQKLSGLTSDYMSQVQKENSIANMSAARVGMTRENTEKNGAGMSTLVSQGMSNRSVYRSKCKSRKSARKGRNMSSQSSGKGVLSHRPNVKQIDTKSGSNGSNSVRRSIRSFIGLKNKTASIRQTKNLSNNYEQNASQSTANNIKHSSLNFNSNSQASLATTKTIDSKFKVKMPQGILNQRNSSLQSRQANEVKKYIFQQKIAQADRFYFDITIRKFFCYWIERYIEQMKKKKTFTTSGNESYSLSLSRNHQKDNLSKTTQSKHKSKKKSSKSGTQKLSQMDQKKKSFNKLELNENSSSKNRFQENIVTQSYSNQHDPKSAISASQRLFNDTGSPLNNNYLTNDLTSIQREYQLSPHHQNAINSSKNSHLNTRNMQKSLNSAQGFENDGINTRQSHQESILNIDSKNNIALENFFGQHNTLKNSKVTRNISAVSNENNNYEFKQTAHLGGDHVRQSPNDKRILSMSSMDQGTINRINKGLKIISKYNVQHMKYFTEDNHRSKSSARAKTRASYSKIKKSSKTKSDYSVYRGGSYNKNRSKSKSNSQYTNSRKSGSKSRSVSQKSNSRCASRVSNPTPSQLNATSHRSGTLATYYKNNSILSSLEQRRSLKPSQPQNEYCSLSNIRQKKFLDKPEKELYSQRQQSSRRRIIKDARSVSPARPANNISILEQSNNRIKDKKIRRNKILLHFFHKWILNVRQQGESHRIVQDINPRKVYRFIVRRKVFAAIKKYSKRCQNVNNAGNRIYQNRINSLISNSFLKWIQNFNQIRLSKKNTFLASHHWVQTNQCRAFRGWRRVVIKRTRFRRAIRQVTPATCLLLLMRFSPSVPRDIPVNQFVGQELFECTKYIQMSSMQKRIVMKALIEYQFNVKKRIFSTLKRNYANVSFFKARMAMKIVYQIIKEWRKYTNRRILKNTKRDKFRYKQMVKKTALIVQAWKFFSQQNKNYRSRLQLFQNHIIITQKRNIMDSIKYYSSLRAIKNRDKTKAQYFIDNKRKMELFSTLIAYNNFRQQKAIRYASIKSDYETTMKTKIFSQLKVVSSILRINEDKMLLINDKHLFNTVQMYFREWQLNYKVMLSARQHHQFRQKLSFMCRLKEGVLLSQINKHKKLKSSKYLDRKMKAKLLTFLNEYKYEQISKRQRRASLLIEVARSKKKLIFILMKLAIQNKIKNDQLKLTLTENYKYSIKAKVISCLRQNIQFEYELSNFEFYQHLKFKREMFDCLKYAVGKQKLLRQALIQTIERRNIQRASIFIDQWRKAAVFKSKQKVGLHERQFYFISKRVLKQFRRIQKYNDQKFEISDNVIDLNSTILKQKYFKIMKMYYKSRYVQVQQIARHYRRKQLLTPAFVSLKKNFAIKIIHNQLQSINKSNTTKYLFNSWLQLFLSKKLDQKAQVYLNYKLKQKAFKFILEHKNSLQMTREQNQMIETFISTRIAKTVFHSLKIYKNVKEDLQKQKLIQKEKNNSQYLSQKFQRWRKYTQLSKLNTNKCKLIKKIQIKNTEQMMFKVWQKKYYDSIKNTKSLKFQKKFILLKVLRFLKSEADRSKNIIDLGKTFDREKRLMKSIFNQIKINNQLRLEAKNKKKWGDHPPLNLNQTITSSYKSKSMLEKEVIVHKGRYIKRKTFKILFNFTQNKLKMNQKYTLCKSLYEKRIRERYMRDIVDCFIVQPKLDEIGELHFLKRNFTSFMNKIIYIKERNNGINMHEFEIRAYEALGKNLLRKSFSAMKMLIHTRKLKMMEEKVIFDYQCRKWFTKWRQNYIIKAQSNYLLPPIDSQNFRERHRSKSKSKSRERLMKNSKQKQTPPPRQNRKQQAVGVVAKSLQLSGDKEQNDNYTFFNQAMAQIHSKSGSEATGQQESFPASSMQKVKQFNYQEFESQQEEEEVFRNQQLSRNNRQYQSMQQSQNNLDQNLPLFNQQMGFQNQQIMNRGMGSQESFNQSMTPDNNMMNNQDVFEAYNQDPKINTGEYNIGEQARFREITHQTDDKESNEEIVVKVNETPKKEQYMKQLDEGMNDTIIYAQRQPRQSPGKQPKQSPQKHVYQIDQSDERLYQLAQTMDDGLKQTMVIQEQESEEMDSQGSKTQAATPVPPLHNLTQRLQKSPMNQQQVPQSANSFKAFLGKNRQRQGLTMTSPQSNGNVDKSPAVTGQSASKGDTSGKKSNLLSNQSMDEDHDDELPATLYL